MCAGTPKGVHHHADLYIYISLSFRNLNDPYGFAQSDPSSRSKPPTLQTAVIGLKLKSPDTGALITVDDLTSPILVSMPVVRMPENQIKPVQAPEVGDVGAVTDAATQTSNDVTNNTTKLVRSCRVGVTENISLVCPSSDVATTEWHVTTKTNISPKVSLAKGPALNHVSSAED